MASEFTGKNLVIVESPAKAKTINKYLGGDFIVKASVGHVRDLPSKNPKGVKAPVPGVDLENDFQPTYTALPRGKKTLAELKKLAKNAPLVYLATDLDREGEAIAWHLAEALKLEPERIRRVVFNEITKTAVQKAFEHPRDIDIDMVNAQQARRILDRIVGYQVSPLLWKKVAGGLSAGRVQSVAVRLIVEREELIEAFMPDEYWKLDGVFCGDPAQAKPLGAEWDTFMAQRDEKNKPPTKIQQQAFLSEHGAFKAELSRFDGKKPALTGGDETIPLAESLGVVIDDTVATDNPAGKGPQKSLLTVACHMADGAPQPAISAINTKETSSRPQPPFTTSSLQQAASSQMYFAARRTMRIAQQLYEGIELPGEGQVGLITYMRTDSRHLSNDSVTAARTFIGDKFGAEYLPEKPNFYTSGKRAQEAHEAIRPTDPTRRPEDLKGCLNEEQFKLYNLIWKRFVACQMLPSRWNVTEVEIQINTADGAATYRATGRTLAFDGFLRVIGLPKDGDPILPELTEGNDVGALAIKPTQHFTQPPSRFTEASLVKSLEAEQIGRPSTYAAIIQTIQDRNYVEKLQRNFRPTDLGRVVVKKLIEGFPEIFNVKFTARMEDELDEVEANKMDWVDVLKEFYGPFKAQLDVAAENMTHAKAETQPSEYTCPDCDSPMEYRFGKNGKFLSCTTYPECKKAMPIDREGKPVTDQFTDIACPLCGGETTLRKGRFGPFISCKTYPACKGVVNLDKKGHIKHPSAPPLAIDLVCPKCEAPTMNVRRSKRGPWISCAKYPKCRGRGAFKSLDEAKQTEIDTALDAHIEANPMPRIHTLEGKDVGDEYTPTVIVETEDGTKTDE